MQNIGRTSSATACAAACEASNNCTSYTWYNADQPGFQLQCWLRMDRAWRLVPAFGVASGCVVGRALDCGPPNPFVADLSAADVGNVLGLFVGGVRAFRARYPNCA